MPYDDPDYGDVGGGLPPDWQPDPAWVPPQHWGYGEPEAVPADMSAIDPATGTPLPPPTDTSTLLQPGLGIPAGVVDDIANAAPPPPPAPVQVAPPPPPQTLGAAIDAIPPSPDAISGAGGMPAEGTVGNTPYAATLTPEQHYAQTVKEFGDNPFDEQGNLRIPDPKEAAQYFRDLRLRDPEKFSTLTAQLGDIKQKRVIAEQHRLANEDFDRQQHNAKMRDTALAEAKGKTDQLVADAMRVAQTPIDRTGGVNKIAGIVMGFIGGLIQGKQGGRNIGLDALNDAINRGIEAQKADLAAQREGLGIRKGALAEEYARTGDAYHSAEVTRIAMLQHAHDQLSFEAQNYASDGTTMLKIADMQGAIVGQQQQAAKAYGDGVFAKSMKLQDAARQQQLADETLRANRAREALDWTKEAREAKKDKADNTFLTPDAIRQRFPNLPVDAIPPGGGTLAQLGKHVDVYNKTLETQHAQIANSPEERARQFSVGEIVDDQGQPVLFRDTVAAGKVTEAKAAADAGVGLIDKMLVARQKYGWSSDLFKSPEWREAKANYAALILIKKDADHLGVLAGPDMGLLGDSLGTTDPTEVRDPSAGLKTARGNMIDNVNTRVRGEVNLPKGRSLARWEPPPTPEVHRDTPDETAAKEVLQDPSREWSADRWYSETGITLSDLARGTPEAKQRLAEIGGLPPSMTATLDGWASDLQGADPKKRDAAAAHLDNAAKVAELPAIRERAQQLLLNNVGAAGIATPPEETR